MPNDLYHPKERVDDDDDDDDKGAFYLRHIYNHFLAFAQMEQKTNFWLLLLQASKQASKVILTNDMGWSRTPGLYLMGNT